MDDGISQFAFQCLFMFVSAVDIVSAIEFDKSGYFLATGGRGGRVVLFERTYGREVYALSPCRLL